MTWWLSRSNDLSVIVEITAVYKRCCDHNIKCYHNTMITVTPTDQYLWPTLRDSPCRLNFQYWSLLRQERLLISSLFTYVMLQVTEFSTTQILSVLPEFRGIEKFLGLVCMKPFNYRSISSDWTKMKPDLAASCPWCFIIYPHNWISHQASYLIVFFLVDESSVSKLYTSFITYRLEISTENLS